MRNGMKVKVTLFLVLFLVVIALIIYIMTSGSTTEREFYNPNPVVATAPPVTTATPVPTPVPTPATPAPTPVPTFSPTPYQPTITPYYAPTPTPYAYTVPTPDIFLHETPVPYAEATPFAIFSTPSVSGTFTSDSGARLNIHADWIVIPSNTTAEISVIVYADHYSIQHHSYESLFVTLGNSTQTLYASEIYSDSNELKHTELGRTSFTIPYTPGQLQTWPLDVKWRFNGTYGKDANGNPISLDTIECGGILTIS